MTKQLLNSQGISAKVIELNQVDNGDDIQKALQVISGQRTVPNVFVKGKHLKVTTTLKQQPDQANCSKCWDKLI